MYLVKAGEITVFSCRSAETSKQIVLFYFIFLNKCYRLLWFKNLPNWSDFVSAMCTSEEEYNSSLQEKLPLIIGSAAAGVVFLIAVVVLIIVCNRWVCW